jgi:DNA processing protein
MESRRAYLALSLIGVFSPETAHRLIVAAGSAAALLKAPLSFFSSFPGLRKSTIHSFMNKRERIHIEREVRSLQEKKIGWVTFADPDYPSPLRHIHSPPLVIYIKGRPLNIHSRFLAVVGTRKCSFYGRRAAEEIIGGLPGSFTVVSGLAAGIDGWAHKVALERGLFTIAVLGTGVDVIYPAVNRRIYFDIANMGALISEFPPGTRPQKHHFPLRNRIISGLSRGVLVVESSLKSGSLITASFALEQGKDLFAVPGSLFKKSCQGTNALIKEGAFPVTESDDILHLWGIPPEEKEQKDRLCLSLTQEEKCVINQLSPEEPRNMEEISEALNGELSLGRLSAALLGLKGKGAVVELVGRRFVLTKEGKEG